MPAVEIIPLDLQNLDPEITTEKAQALIDSVLARAREIAPCIGAVEFAKTAVAKAIIVDAILRRAQSGSGALQSGQIGSGSWTFDTRTPRVLFWPAEISELQSLCAASSAPAGDDGPLYSFPPADA